jgi:hypothetical protein
MVRLIIFHLQSVEQGSCLSTTWKPAADSVQSRLTRLPKDVRNARADYGWND